VTVRAVSLANCRDGADAHDARVNGGECCVHDARERLKAEFAIFSSLARTRAAAPSVDSARIPGGDGAALAVLAKHGWQLGEGFESCVGANVLIFFEADRVAFFIGARDGE
jgi:hypothetical protein